MKTLREYLDQLDEISRRDFLKGAGAVAGLAATDALAAPWQHRTSKDPMDDKVNKEINVLSTDKRAKLHVGISDDFVQLQTNDLIDYDNYGSEGGRGNGRFRLGTLAPDDIKIIQTGRSSRYAELYSEKIDLKQTLLRLKNPTIVKIQVPVLGSGSRTYIFEIEPDSQTKQFAVQAQQRSKEEQRRQIDKHQKEYADIIKRSQNPIVRKDRESGSVNEFAELDETDENPIQKIDRLFRDK